MINPSMEDLFDLQAIIERADEPSRSFEAVLKDLKRDGLLSVH